MRILAFAYACEPAKGSEPGAGWEWARILGRLGETWVVTRSNNRPAIEAALPSVPERDRLRFLYVDLPTGVRRWKRGQRGVRLYYVLWQFAALRRARALTRSVHFDVVWHLTFANAWIGSVGALVGPPFLYGPVGGGVKPPLGLVPTLGWWGAAYELLRVIAQTAGRYLNPLARMSWSRARLILVQNPDTRAWLPASSRAKTVVFPNVVLEADLPRRAGSAVPAHPSAAFAGRLLPWKGAALALRTLTLLPDWRLVVFGSGRDEPRLRRLASRLSVGPRVRFAGALSREGFLRALREDSSVLLHPSLHDEAGWVVAEAIASGVPVVSLDRGGPPVLGARGVRASTATETARRLATAVVESARRPPPSTPFGPDHITAGLKEILSPRGLMW